MHYIWSFSNFFNLNQDNDYSSFSYDIFSLKQEMAYIIAFIPKEKIISDKTSDIFIKKFGFKSFDEHAYDELKSVTFQNFENQKILNVFLMVGDEDENTFVVFTCTENFQRRRISKIIPPGDWLSLRKTPSYNYYMKFYNKDLDDFIDIYLNDGYFATYYNWEELFIKSLYLDNRIVSFIYFKEGDDSFYFELFELNYKGEERYIDSKNVESIRISIYQPFSIGESLNDFVKIKNNRLAFIYTSSSYTCILIININKNSKAINIMDYYIDFEEYIPKKQLFGYSYNNYLMLAVSTQKNSMFMIFGYTKGIDKELDNNNLYYIQIAEANNDIFNFLIEDLKIDNNIFGYFPLRAIKFISTPEVLDISIYNSESGNSHQLQLNDILCSYEYESEQENTQFCNDNYGIINSMTISQNTDIIKENQYYYIEYQYVSIEKYLNCPVTSYGSYSSYSSYSSYNSYSSHILSIKKL